MVKAAQIGETS